MESVRDELGDIPHAHDQYELRGIFSPEHCAGFIYEKKHFKFHSRWYTTKSTLRDEPQLSRLSVRLKFGTYRALWHSTQGGVCNMDTIEKKNFFTINA
jgi:hypothetical protein